MPADGEPRAAIERSRWKGRGGAAKADIAADEDGQRQLAGIAGRRRDGFPPDGIPFVRSPRQMDRLTAVAAFSGIGTPPARLQRRCVRQVTTPGQSAAGVLRRAAGVAAHRSDGSARPKDFAGRSPACAERMLVSELPFGCTGRLRNGFSSQRTVLSSRVSRHLRTQAFNAERRKRGNRSAVLCPMSGASAGIEEARHFLSVDDPARTRPGDDEQVAIAGHQIKPPCRSSPVAGRERRHRPGRAA